MTWTDPETLKVSPGDIASSADQNALLDDLIYLNESKCPYARVAADASIGAQSGGITVEHPNTGRYLVNFAAEVGAVAITPVDTAGSGFSAVALKTSTLQWELGIQDGGVATDRGFCILGIAA